MLVTQSCPILCDPMHCSLPGASVLGAPHGQNTGVGCHSLLQGIFLTEGLNPGLLYCRWMLYQLSYEGSHICISSLSLITIVLGAIPIPVFNQFSCSVVSNSLQPHGLQHTRLPCPLPSPRVCTNSCPFNR